MPESSVHSAFELLRETPIESLHIIAQEYEHKRTGARHLHFKSDNEENVFLVGLKTLPTDSTGVAHILEHTALCGSKRYPVRDPFFMMIRRSLNTFMNAFTSSDWTAYPFASKNRKDFANLLDVYLDAVFFSRLDEMDFLQEGHRVEFETPDDPSTDLVYKGVVYNEMKGAMSSPVSTLWHTITRYLFPTTTYHHNSGGEPEHIVDLTYDQLKAFYKKHYHPSNAVFFTFGNIPAFEHHEVFENLALKHFNAEDHGIHLPDEKRYFSPLRVREAYAVDSQESIENKTHVLMAWLLGKSFDLQENLEAHLLSNVLFENSAAPLQKLLETSELGAAPSPLCGLEDSNREMAFMCGIEGAEPGCEKALEDQVLSVLNQIADEGVAQERLEAVLHQLELSQREVSGDSYPYGLQLILTALSPMIHGGDPVALLDIDPVLKDLSEKIKDPNYFKSLVKKHLIDNVHRVTLSLEPDQNLESVRQEAMRDQLEAMKSSLGATESQIIIDRAAALSARQLEKDDESILPKVGIEDVPHHLAFVDGKTYQEHSNIELFEQGTNGLVYVQVLMPVPQLSEDELAILPIYAHSMTELGAGDQSYMAMQNQMSAVTGGLSAYASIRGGIANEQDCSAYFVLSGKSLKQNYAELVGLLHQFADTVRFDETARLKDLISQLRARKEKSVTGSGHALAMGVASSGMSPVARFNFETGGVAGIHALKALDDALETEESLSDFAHRLSALHAKFASMARRYLVVAESEVCENVAGEIVSRISPKEESDQAGFSLEPVRETVKEAWMTSTQVNFCSKAYPTVPVEHPDAPALTVLGGFLRNGFLHRAIREQGGAYGSGANQDSSIAAFRFFSYRDPRLEETLADFDASIDWMLSEEHSESELEQAILGVVSSIDKPKSPAGEAKAEYHNLLFGRSQAQREAFRANVLKVTLDDLEQVTRRYLKNDEASLGLITHSGNKELVESLGLTVKEI